MRDYWAAVIVQNQSLGNREFLGTVNMFKNVNRCWNAKAANI